MIDLVVPCFNEANRWSPDYWRSMFELPGIRWTFVNDGSTDTTAEALAATSSEGPALVVTLPQNSGKAEAVRQGMLGAMADDSVAVGYMDADGAFNPDDVADIARSFRQHVLDEQAFDAVWSSRVALAGRNIDRHASRHYIGRIVATVVSQGEQQIPYDTQSGLKLFQPTDLLQTVLSTPFRTRWVFELEILSRWRAGNGGSLRVWEEPLNYWHDVPGSKIRGAEMFRIVRELAVIKKEQRKARQRLRDSR